MSRKLELFNINTDCVVTSLVKDADDMNKLLDELDCTWLNDRDIQDITTGKLEYVIVNADDISDLAEDDDVTNAKTCKDLCSSPICTEVKDTRFLVMGDEGAVAVFMFEEAANKFCHDNDYVLKEIPTEDVHEYF